ncbi:MAG TPA: hypothetical protein VMV10_08110 [Pirellulales bacterium]|nr:hypothetical protein [Pirellulales bacterium]
MDVRQIRQRVIEAIEERELGSTTLIGETVLVRGGYYAGRRFVFEEVEAVWLIDSDRICLFANNGEPLPPIDLNADASQRPAA